MKLESKRNSLVSLTLIYAIGNFGSKALSFILFFYITYFLSKEEIGRYDIIFTTLTLVVPCITLSIDYSLFRWVAGNSDEVSRGLIFKNVFGVLISSAVIFSAIYWVVIGHIDIIRELDTYIYIYAILMIFHPALLQGTRGIDKNKLYVFAGIIYALINVIVVVALLSFTDLKLRGILIGNALSLACVSIFLIYRNNWDKYLLTPLIDKTLVKELLSYSLPLIPNTLSWWLINYAVRFVILFYLGQEENGIFAISYKYPTVLLIFTDVFALAWQEKLIKMENVKFVGPYFTETLNNYVKLLFSLILILSAFSTIFMGLVEPGFYEAWRYTPILLYGVALQALAGFFGAAFLMAKKTKFILVSSVVGGILTVLTSFFLVKYKLVGISISIVVGFIFMLGIRMAYLKKIMKFKFSFLWFLGLTLLYITVSALLYLENTKLNYFLIGLSIIIFMWVNRSIINIKYIRKKIGYE